ncbi:MAG: aminoacyl-tRNA hydrolase [Spirochaetaceae bacterium]|nr:aminoacyl-tRNA hydrolase [Spirochaetaceae bacterium]
MVENDTQVVRDWPLPGGGRIPAAEIEELASRSSGPGGQHVNTSSTRVSLRWNVRDSAGVDDPTRKRLLERLASRLSRAGVLTVHADRHRSRRRNREAAWARLCELVEAALHEAAPRTPTRPTRASGRRRLETKRKRGDLKRGRGRRPDDQD